MSNILKGIDVSYAQGNIDFTKINKSQVQFAVIRSSFGWEDGQKDDKFERNYGNFKKLGIPVGAYHYSYARTKEQAILEAKYCIKCIKGKNFDLPIYYDMEDPSMISSGKRNLTDAAKAFCNYLISKGYRAGIYTNPNWLVNYLYKDELLGNYSIWLAQWGTSKAYYNNWDLWQYNVGKKGSISGISGEIDLDYMKDTVLSKKINTTKSSTNNTKTNTNVVSNDRDKFLKQAATYIGKDGYYVCKTKLKLSGIFDWCAFSVSAIMKDCGFIGVYQEKIYSFASDNARNDNGKFGTFFIKGQKTPQPGDLIMFRYSNLSPIDKYSASHVGIVEKVSGNVITTLEGNVEGNNNNWAETSTFKRKTRYLSDSTVYSFFRFNWKTTTKTKNSTSTNNSNKKLNKPTSLKITYQVYTNGRWLPWVTDYNTKNTDGYAGIENSKIQGIRIRAEKVDVKYRVRLTNGKWLPWVTNYNTTDDNGYAGILGKDIDCLQVYLIGDNDYKVQYRVSNLNKTTYLPWVTNYNNDNDDGYAGIVGKPIDKLQMRINKK